MGTLFIGTAHRELIPNKNKNESAEVITLSLTFDHRVVNGAGAAAFANEIKQQIETRRIPKSERTSISRWASLRPFSSFGSLVVIVWRSSINQQRVEVVRTHVR